MQPAYALMERGFHSEMIGMAPPYVVLMKRTVGVIQMQSDGATVALKGIPGSPAGRHPGILPGAAIWNVGIQSCPGREHGRDNGRAAF